MFKNLLLTFSVLLLGASFSLAQTTISVPILSGTDDAEEVGPSGHDGSNRPTGELDLTSSDLEITDDVSWNGAGQILGLRFTNISIPNGALITSAHVEFVSKSDEADAASFTIKGEASDNALTFENTVNNISIRSTTNASVDWNNAEAWTAGETYNTPDVSSLIQEVVDREAWTNGNALSLLITGTGVRRAFSYDNSAETAPKLVVNYITANVINTAILASSDDAEEVVNPDNTNPVGFIDLGSSDIELVDDNTWNGKAQNVGLRFTNLDIPKGAAIISAHIEFTSKYNDEAEATSVIFKAEDINNSPTFTSESMNISSRTTTTTMVEWNDIPQWTTQGGKYKSPNLSILFEEVVAKEDWANGNAISIIVTGSGERTAYSFDNSAETAPRLILKYIPQAMVSAQILASSDDAEEVVNPDNTNPVGFIDLASSDIELVDDNTWNGKGQNVGLRFANLDIPQGAIITKAYLEFTSKYSDEAEATSLVLKAEASDNATTFTSESMNISSRTTTNNLVEWNDIPQWTTQGGKYTSPDLSSIIGEVVAREGWANGNAISILVTGSGERTAYSFDNSAETAPKLYIEYLQGEITYSPELVNDIPNETIKTGWNYEIDVRPFFRDLDSELEFKATSIFGAGLPTGLLLNNGILSGSIAEAGVYPIEVWAKSDGDSISDMFVLTVEPNQTRMLEVLGSLKLGAFDEGAAEISAYDPASKKLFVTNAEMKTIDIIDMTDPSNLSKLSSINLPAGTGGVNSVASFNGLIVAAYEAENKQNNGFVYAYDANGVEQWNVTVGALPDMVTFNEDGSKIIVANEGEPNDDYTVDPEGTVSIIDVATQAVSTADFTAFNGQEATLALTGVRVFGPNASVSQDFEPEYITIKGNKAYVTLQENNAIAVIDIETATVESVKGLGFKNHSLPGNGLDVPETEFISISNWPFMGAYMPDAIASYEANGKTYLVTANEGDSRDYAGYSEESEIGDITLDPSVFPNADMIQEYASGLKITTANADTNSNGEYRTINTFGARSFTIWDAETGTVVYDSGDDLEQITGSLYPENFNASNTNFSFKNRSDDKGPEPESVTIGMVDGVPHAFIGLERIGGIMVYNISNPAAPEFVEYFNNRNFDAADEESLEAGDSGPEGIIFIPAADSPIATDMIVVSNEISGTVTAYSIGQAQQPFTLNIFHNNDGESKLIADTITYLGERIPAGSISQFKQTLEDQRAEARNRGYESILLSSGDNFLAGLEYNAGVANGVYYDAVAMDSMHYDAIDLGNHDFDFGTQVLAEYINTFDVNKTPYLSSNLGFSNVPELQALVESGRIKSSTIIERDGEFIGVVGLTTPLLPTISSPGNTVVSEAIIDSVQKEVDLLTGAGVNKIILISHLQGLAEDFDLAKELTGIDIMIAGGGDELLSNDPNLGAPYNITAVDSYPITTQDKDGKNVYIITTPGSYRYLGNLLIDFNDAGEVTRVYETNPILVKGAYDPTLLANIEEPILDYIGNLSTNVIAFVEDTLDFRRETLRGAESNGGNLFADAVLYQAKKNHANFGVKEPQVAIQNSGGLRIEALIKEGNFTEDLTYKIAAFDNIVSVVEDIAPEKFLALMEHGVANAPALDGRFPQIAGFEIVYDQAAEAGNRIQSIKLDDGTMIVENSEVVTGAPAITLATINFTAGGGDGYPFAPLEYTTLGATYQQAFLNYLTAEDGLDSLVTEAMYPYDEEPTRIKFFVTETEAVDEIDEDFAACPDIAEGWVEYNSDADLIYCDGGAVAFNGYSVGAGTSWLIAPKVKIEDGYVLSFEKSLLYGGPNPELVYSSDYTGLGDPNSATWTTFTEGTNLISSGTGSLVETGDLELSTISDEAVYFAFRYTSNGTSSGQSKLFKIDNFKVSAPVVIPTIGYKSIPELQGSGAESPFDNSKIETAGIVTKNFSGDAYSGAGFNANMDGFFIQDVDGDGDASTSDGIYVYSDATVSVGDSVYIIGVVEEMFGQTQIGDVESVDVKASNKMLPNHTEITLPLSSQNEFEKYEGMLVKFIEALYVTENRNVDNFGEVRLSADGIMMKSTNVLDPNDADVTGTSSDGLSNVAAVLAHTAENKAKSFVLEDNRSGSNNLPIPFLSSEGNIRAGSYTNGQLDGILSYGFSEYRLHPITVPSFTYNEREEAPEFTDASLKVASFNVLNYFNGDGMGDYSGNSRGTKDAALFAKQSEKIVQALVEIDADVVGLMEIENDETGDKSAMKTLTDSLNAKLGSEVYAYVETGRVARADNSADEIKNGFLYKTSTIELVGDYAILNNSVFPSYKDESSRPAIAQTFREIATDELFTAVVNHLKSKGSSCSGDADMNDDQGNCNESRRQAAGAIAAWLDTDPTGSGDTDFLIMGDLNSYAQEDPIDTLRAMGYATLTENTDYTYVFDGEHGSLDHALANDDLKKQVVETKVWHINSVEPDFLAYDGLASKYTNDAFRSSDHDPVVIGLKLGDVTVGTELDLLTNEITAYPNPSNGVVNFSQSVSATIYNQVGMLVTEFENETSVTLEEKGLYIIKFSNGKTTKVVIK